jgi:phytanoyl-CoA hydroxylase
MCLKDPLMIDKSLYFNQHGYVVWRNLVELDLCERAMLAFKKEVKPHKGFIYRQTTANPERHKYDESGHVINPILNPLCVNEKLFPDFRKISHEILASDELFDAAASIIGEPVTAVQSMYFEGGSGTWAHQDTYYLDSEKRGSMAAAWIALEDIHEDAGRFFIGVNSHKTDIEINKDRFDIAFNHARYKSLVLNFIQKNKVELRAPDLKRGDVLFWNSKTIHGSHPPRPKPPSRSSFTIHFIPSAAGFLQHQHRLLKIKPSITRGHSVYLPKDQNRLINRIILLIECQFPRSFQLFKKMVSLIYKKSLMISARNT